ncbi:MAG: response regulator transcription factor [Pseudomonadota bacterium]
MSHGPMPSISTGDDCVTIRVLMIIATRLYREGLARQLGLQPGIDVVASLGGISQALTECQRQQPNILLIDLAVPGSREFLFDVKAGFPAIRTVCMSVPDCADSIVACAETGVSGFLTQEGSVEELIEAMHGALRGQFACSPDVTAVLVQRLSSYSVSQAPNDLVATLTERELQVVRLIDRGLTNKAIATRLMISVPTVKNHVHHILDKLNVRSRTEAASLVRKSYKLVQL